ncbi:MAG: hypothetical protein NTY45_01115 [Elusimicrobia bacterium]|nr:hypothetical protein [Elusimicrobiota bacterium]
MKFKITKEELAGLAGRESRGFAALARAAAALLLALSAVVLYLLKK